MAMNKKEQAEMDALRRELRLAKAFKFTEAVEPDVMPPTWGEGLRKGFLFNDYIGNSSRVDVACTDSTYHSFGNDDKTTTQGTRRLYSTRRLALGALRHSVEKKCAEILANIDAQIEKEQQ